MRIGGYSQVPAQSLCTRLADMQSSADGAYRGNTILCQVSRERDCGRGLIVMPAGHMTDLFFRLLRFHDCSSSDLIAGHR